MDPRWSSTGSRSASVDATFSDHADDCTDNGFPRPQGYVMNLTAIARGEPRKKHHLPVFSIEIASSARYDFHTLSEL